MMNCSTRRIEPESSLVGNKRKFDEPEGGSLKQVPKINEKPNDSALIAIECECKPSLCVDCIARKDLWSPHRDIAREATRKLIILTIKSHANAAANRETIFRAGGHAVVFSNMKKYCDHKDMVADGLALLINLCGNEVCRGYIAKLPFIVPFIVQRIDAFPDCQIIYRFGLILLINLCQNECDNQIKVQALKAGVVTSIGRAMIKWPEDLVIKHTGGLILRNLAHSMRPSYHV
jgi:hypothetical protein